MPIIKSDSAPTFEHPGLTCTGLASPARGSSETSMWRLCIAPGTAGTPHSLDREELFAALAGRAVVTLGDETFELAAGDALVVPPHVPFSLANPHAEPFEAIAALPVGGRAVMPTGQAFVPPWAL
jgi:mannose-6-phosphate isomerase-like protein (cupin superfamily)